MTVLEEIDLKAKARILLVLREAVHPEGLDLGALIEKSELPDLVAYRALQTLVRTRFVGKKANRYFVPKKQ